MCFGGTGCNCIGGSVGSLYILTILLIVVVPITIVGVIVRCIVKHYHRPKYLLVNPQLQTPLLSS
jgi:hypothetical protein